MAKKNRRDSAWWDVWPTRYAQELAAFEGADARLSNIEKKNGILTLNVEWPIPRGQADLKIEFSPLHPFCRPSVYSDSLNLTRHQNPTNGGICLITQETDQWDSTQLVADLISQQLKELFCALSERERGNLSGASSHEENAPDPLMPYYNGLSELNSVLFFHEDLVIEGHSAGYAEFELGTRSLLGRESIEGALLRLFDVDNRPLRVRSVERDASRTVLRGRWVSLSGIKGDDPSALWQQAEAKIRSLAIVMPKAAQLCDLQASGGSVLGICFEDEVAYDGRTKLGWIFLHKSTPVSTPRFVRAERIEIDRDTARAPFAISLKPKRVMVVGCGAIGSFIALELARSGCGSMHLWDSDVVQPANSVRWPLGKQYWGVSKTFSLADFISSNYPSTKVKGTVGRLDNAEVGDNAFTALQNAIDWADVVVDATASSEVQYCLSWFCKELKKPLVSVHGTAGAVAGVVFQQPAEAIVCRVCLNEAWAAGELPEPSIDPDGMVVPLGCNEATFRGGSFDLQEVSLQAVRTAIGLLIPGFSAGGWDVAQVELRDAQGARSKPTWETYKIAPKQCCARNAA